MRDSGSRVDSPQATDVSHEASDSGGELEENRGRKRHRNVEEWESTVAKVKRNLGQAYISYKTKKEVAERTIGNPCHDECFNKVTQEGVEKIFSEFWALGSYDIQNAYIQKMVEVVPVKRKRTKEVQSKRSNTRQYSVVYDNVKTKVCKEGFMAMHGIGTTRLTTALRKVSSTGALIPDQRGKHRQHSHQCNHPMKAQLNHGVVPSQFIWSRKLSTEISVEEEEANEQVEMITRRKITDFENSVHTRMLPFKCSPHSGEQVIQDLKESPGSSSSKGKWSNRGQKSKLKQVHAQRDSKARGRITRGTSNGGGSGNSDEGTVADCPFVHVDMEQFSKEEPNCNDLVIKEHCVDEDFLNEGMDSMDEVVVKGEKDVDESLMDEDEFHDNIVKEEVEIDERLKEEPGGMPAEDCNVKEIKEWYVEGCTIKQEAEEGL